jgi:ribose/xylose/arabinose/galactoside ABC-type transport system permease subunit
MKKGWSITPSVAVVVVLLLLIVFGGIRYDGFLGVYNIQSVLRYISMFAFVSLGMCFVIMTGGIDLSVGSVAAVQCRCSIAQSLWIVARPARWHCGWFWSRVA